MSAAAWTVCLDAATTRLLRRYRGEKPADLDAAGHPTTDRAARRQP